MAASPAPRAGAIRAQHDSSHILADERFRATAALRELQAIRVIAIAMQGVVLLAASRLTAIELPWAAIAALLATSATVAAGTFLRLRDPAAVTDGELLVQLSLDLLAFTAVLALSGGAANPFGGIVVIPLVLGAVWLAPRSAWTLSAIGVVCGIVLVWLAQPLAMGHQPGAPLRSAALFASHCVTAAAVAAVMLRFAFALRREQEALNAARRKAEADAHIERLGALAAGAAHDLSGPLGSLSLLVDELRAEFPQGSELGLRLALAARLAAQCRETLLALLSCWRASAAPSESVRCAPFVQACIDAFAIRRPESAVSLCVESPGRGPLIPASRAMRQALTSVLDNAADVSPHRIEVSLSWDAHWMHIRVRDRGPGIRAEVLETLGKLAFITTKKPGKGNGVGLYLATNAISQLGGSLVLSNAGGGGALAEITLPRDAGAAGTFIRPEKR